MDKKIRFSMPNSFLIFRVNLILKDHNVKINDAIFKIKKAFEREHFSL